MNCLKCGCEIDGPSDVCSGCMVSVNSLLSAIEGAYEGMAQSDLVLTCKMLSNGREAWRKDAEEYKDRLLAIRAASVALKRDTDSHETKAGFIECYQETYWHLMETIKDETDDLLS